MKNDSTIVSKRLNKKIVRAVMSNESLDVKGMLSIKLVSVYPVGAKLLITIDDSKTLKTLATIGTYYLSVGSSLHMEDIENAFTVEIGVDEE